MALSKETAAKMLQQAYEAAVTGVESGSEFKSLVDQLLGNTHLTFKYILFTELLAKATDDTINTLCLQAGSTLPGAYDARTICHKVIVPFEMETLGKVLGGSNEPFLNKPARFPELDKSNPVRRGNDQMLLDLLCDTLPQIDTSEKAYRALVYFLQVLIQIRKEIAEERIFSLPPSANAPSTIVKFLSGILENSFEGETLTLAVAGAYKLLFPENNVSVEVHPVNQCGASSKEVSDLDIYIDGRLDISNELKDKDYVETDVRHAADKVIVAGGTKLLFIEGPRAHCIDASQVALREEYLSRNFLLTIVPAWQFIETALSLAHQPDSVKMMNFIMEKAYNTKFKNECIAYIDAKAQTILGLSR